MTGKLSINLKFALAILILFTSTYLCETAFSEIQIIYIDHIFLVSIQTLEENLSIVVSNITHRYIIKKTYKSTYQLNFIIYTLIILLNYFFIIYAYLFKVYFFSKAIKTSLCICYLFNLCAGKFSLY